MMEEYYYFWLNNIPGIGNSRIKRLLERFETAENLFRIEEVHGREKAAALLKAVRGIKEKDIENLLSLRIKGNILKKYQQVKESGIEIVYPASEKYPEKLKNIFDPPYIIYYRGKLPDSSKKTVAIVGARNCSEYGRAMAERIGTELGSLGIQVVSGFARGIDTAAHNGCLKGKGNTFAVLGSGVDVCYPSENIYTYREIIKYEGGILSEFYPNTGPHPGLFPLRNRIISGISDLVIVIEAGEKSGSLITADHALEQNKTVMALPGRATDRLSIGCNRLIKQGAAIITSMEDILFELGVDYEKNMNKRENSEIKLATPEKMLYSLVSFNPVCINELIKKSALPANEVIRALSYMELEGLIRETGKNYYIRNL